MDGIDLYLIDIKCYFTWDGQSSVSYLNYEGIAYPPILLTMVMPKLKMTRAEKIWFHASYKKEKNNGVSFVVYALIHNTKGLGSIPHKGIPCVNPIPLP